MTNPDLVAQVIWYLIVGVAILCALWTGLWVAGLVEGVRVRTRNANRGDAGQDRRSVGIRATDSHHIHVGGALIDVSSSGIGMDIQHSSNIRADDVAVRVGFDRRISVRALVTQGGHLEGKVIEDWEIIGMAFIEIDAATVFEDCAAADDAAARFVRSRLKDRHPLTTLKVTSCVFRRCIFRGIAFQGDPDVVAHVLAGLRTVPPGH